MQKTKIVFLTVGVAACMLGSLSSYAGADSCETGYVHCVYTTGLDGKQGKTVKFEDVGGTLPAYSECMDNSSSLSVDQDSMNQLKKKAGDVITWKISQCTDAQCTNSIVLTQDQFRLGKTGDKFTAEPSLAPIALNKTYGTDCAVHEVKRIRNALVKR